MYHVLESLYCRDADGCPTDHFHMATYSPDFETGGSREKEYKQFIYVSRTRCLCYSIAGSGSCVA